MIIWLRNFLLRILYSPITRQYNWANVSFSDERGRILSPSRIIGGPQIVIGEKTRVGAYAWIETIEKYRNDKYNATIKIGKNSYLGNHAVITAIDKITIGDDVVISDQIYISDHSHGIDIGLDIPIILQPLFSKGPVIIGNNCFIGLRVSILPGVTLGNGCIVGSHSVVTHSFPEKCMIAGAPAKIIKKYSDVRKAWEAV